MLSPRLARLTVFSLIIIPFTNARTVAFEFLFDRQICATSFALADNAGQEGALIVAEVKKRKGNEGYNVATGEYEDLIKAGVVDPAKVTRSALQHAASISGLLLTTECVVTEAPEKKAPAGGGDHPHPPGGMDY